MVTDPSSPTVLVRVPSEFEARVIANALSSCSISARTTGAFTSQFKAEAPGQVAVIVPVAELEKARRALARIRREQSDLAWWQPEAATFEGDFPETCAEAQDSDSGDEESRLMLVDRPWWIVEILGVVICLFVWLISGEVSYLAYAIVAVVFVGLVVRLSRYARRRRSAENM